MGIDITPALTYGLACISEEVCQNDAGNAVWEKWHTYYQHYMNTDCEVYDKYGGCIDEDHKGFIEDTEFHKIAKKYGVRLCAYGEDIDYIVQMDYETSKFLPLLADRETLVVEFHPVPEIPADWSGRILGFCEEVGLPVLEGAEPKLYSTLYVSW